MDASSETVMAHPVAAREMGWEGGMDIATLLTGNAVVSAASAGVMFLTAFTRKTYPGFAWWTAGVACMALGATMFVPRLLPDYWLLTALRNDFLLAGLVMIYRGMRIFRQQAVGFAWEWVVALSFVPLFAYYSLDPNRLAVRIIIFSVYACVLSLAIVAVTLRRRPAHFGSNDWLLALCLSVFCGLSFIRGLGQWLLPVAKPALESLTGYQAFYILMQILTVHLVTLALININSQRTEHELAESRAGLERRVAERTLQLARLAETLRADVAAEQAAGETLVRARDAAENASRAKATFLANMSHEIRTPMNAIIGLTHLLARDAPDVRSRERLSKVDGAAKHLLHVINDILDLSKIDAGKMVLEDAEFSLNETLRQALDLVAQSARDKGVELQLDYAEVPARMRGDPTRLAQAVLNLLSNAVKFTDQGSVRLRCELVEKAGFAAHADSAIRPELLVRFVVTDTGAGIAPEAQGALFGAFEQADASTTRRYGGTGLGLALTRHIARMMGGEAGFTSTLGQGSSFWFTARLMPVEAGPAEPAAESVAESVAQSAAQSAADDQTAGQADGVKLRRMFQGQRVLLAEDNPVNQEVASELLRVLGLSVVSVDNGASAVELARSQAFDLVLMDVQMPGMDGLSATRAIRSSQGAGLPIIAMTANAFEEDRQACIAAGMNDHVAKPVDPAQLQSTLTRWLQS